MSKICKNCAAYNSDYATFCKDCGKPLGLPQTSRDRKIVTAIAIVITILIAGYMLYDPGMIETEVPLETHDFESFTMDAPVGCDFDDSESIPDCFGPGGEIYMENVGDYSYEIQMFGFTTLGVGDDILDNMNYLSNENGVDIYADADGADFYVVTKSVGDYDFVVMGTDPDVMVDMLNSIEFEDA